MTKAGQELVEVRDFVLWLKHIHGASNLQARLLALDAREIVFLKIDGKVGIWERMRDGSDGSRTTGLKPSDARTRELWHALFRERPRERVRIEAVEESSTMEPARTPVQKHKPNGSRKPKQTTEIGYTNRNKQAVIRKTDMPGNHHNQMIYVLRCGECKHEYGANGADIFQRRCPKCGGGTPGLAV